MYFFEVKKLSKNFGGLAAVAGVDFHIDRGEVVGLIGPNGAGKTTTFNLICGAAVPTTGKITFKGDDITGLKPHQICRKKIARTFQSIELFPYMTASQNVLIGALFGASNKMAKARQETQKYLEFVGLSKKSEVLAKDLIISEQKHLEIARALAAKPDLLLLDEVMAGLNPTEVAVSIDLIRKINNEQITILMIEHIMHAIMGVSDRIIALHYGSKIAEGTPEEITTNNKIIEIYLGE